MAASGFIPAGTAGFDGQVQWSKNRGSGAASPAPLSERLLAVAASEAPVPAEQANAVRFEWGLPMQQSHRVSAAIAAGVDRIVTGAPPAVGLGGLRSVAQLRADHARQEEEAAAAATARVEALRAYAESRGDVESVLSIDELLSSEYDEFVSWDVA